METSRRFASLSLIVLVSVCAMNMPFASSTSDFFISVSRFLYAHVPKYCPQTHFCLITAASNIGFDSIFSSEATHLVRRLHYLVRILNLNIGDVESCLVSLMYDNKSFNSARQAASV